MAGRLRVAGAGRMLGIAALAVGLACGAEAPDPPQTGPAPELESPAGDRVALAPLPAREAPERPRVLLLGLDGADWDVLDPLLEMGVLPNLARLVRGGARAELDCAPAMPETACFCPPVWVSVATGVPFSQHNIAGMHDVARQRKATALWAAAAAHGVTSTLVSYRNTWEPEESPTYVLTEYGLDFASEARFVRRNDEPTLRTRIESKHTKPVDLFETLGLLPYTGERPTVWPMMARDRVAMDATLRLVAKDPTDLLVVLLHAIDKAEHVFWASVQPNPGDPIDADAIRAQAARWNGPVTDAETSVASQYLEADAWLGELLATVPVEYVVVASDHGMERSPAEGLAGQHSVELPAAHQGVFVVAGRGVRAGARLPRLDVFDVAPTVAHLLGIPVAADLPGALPEAAFEPEWLAAHPVQQVDHW